MTLLWKHSNKQVSVSSTLRIPHLNVVLQVRPHQHRGERQDHLPRPAGRASFDAAQDMVGFLGCEDTLPAHVHQPILPGLSWQDCTQSLLVSQDVQKVASLPPSSVWALAMWWAFILNALLSLRLMVMNFSLRLMVMNYVVLILSDSRISYSKTYM